MTVYQSSLLGVEDQAEQDTGFHKVLDIMIDPAIQMCISASEEKKKTRPRWDDKVFVLNCLSYLQVRHSLLNFINPNHIIAIGRDGAFFFYITKTERYPGRYQRTSHATH